MFDEESIRQQVNEVQEMKNGMQPRKIMRVQLFPPSQRSGVFDNIVNDQNCQTLRTPGEFPETTQDIVFKKHFIDILSLPNELFELIVDKAFDDVPSFFGYSTC